jgi:hypothetical protein
LKPDDLNWPVVYSGGAAVFFGPTGGFGRAYFGGPLDQRFEPPPDGPAPLQRIFTFDVGELPKPEGRILEGNLSLFFGMQYNGCVLSYRMPVLRYKLRGANAIAARIQDAQALEIVELHPSSSSDGVALHWVSAAAAVYSTDRNPSRTDGRHRFRVSMHMAGSRWLEATGNGGRNSDMCKSWHFAVGSGRRRRGRADRVSLRL